MGHPCMHDGGIAPGSQTTASWAAVLSALGVQHWVTGTAAPCTGLFKPVRVEEPLDLGPAPTDQADDASLWWRHERLHRRVVADPARLLPLYREQRDAVEKQWLADPPEPADGLRGGERLLGTLGRRGRTQAGADTRPRFVRRYWKKRDQRAGCGSIDRPATPSENPSSRTVDPRHSGPAQHDHHRGNGFRGIKVRSLSPHRRQVHPLPAPRAVGGQRRAIGARSWVRLARLGGRRDHRALGDQRRGAVPVRPDRLPARLPRRRNQPARRAGNRPGCPAALRLRPISAGFWRAELPPGSPPVSPAIGSGCSASTDSLWWWSPTPARIASQSPSRGRKAGGA